MSRTHFVGIDFETYGTRDLKKVNRDQYMSDPNFRPLIVALVGEGINGDELVQVFDFVCEPDAIEAFRKYTDAHYNPYLFAAHNAGFERGVMHWLNKHHAIHGLKFVDSAVVSRCMGAASHLEAAAPQLLGIDKMPEGKRLLQKFSKPCEYNGFAVPTAELVRNDPDWQTFKDYCIQDARASVQLCIEWQGLVEKENLNEELTSMMNFTGWNVDLPAVKEMQRRYFDNVEMLRTEFQVQYDQQEKLNLNSTVQLRKWCLERGVRTTSFDEEHVETLLAKVREKLDIVPVTDPKWTDYQAVHDLLELKQAMGGSSLKKLQTILDTVGEDGRLRDQYMHCGAGQTYRTSGRGVQMQNLKRLSKAPKDMQTLFDSSIDWTNEELAENIRQVFTARHPQGRLIVGDFSSVESRGLAFIAGEDWKVDAYKQGKDLYKMLATKLYHIDYDAVNTERQGGKVGELSCGYGAGGSAVVSFAKKLHINLSLDEANTLVRDWRNSCPATVKLWDTLDHLLHQAVLAGFSDRTKLANGFEVQFSSPKTPESLKEIRSDVRSIELILYHDGWRVLSRVFHGCYERGRNINYFKPSSLKNGPLWKDWYIDPKTKHKKYYDLYGGKLTGILVQSFCRELFFQSLREFNRRNEDPGSTLVGQFHDEIVVEWNPELSMLTLEQAEDRLYKAMTYVGAFQDFPLSAEVHSAYRYIK